MEFRYSKLTWSMSTNNCRRWSREKLFSDDSGWCWQWIQEDDDEDDDSVCVEITKINRKSISFISIQGHVLERIDLEVVFWIQQVIPLTTS
jgi:hypothetical protein